MSRGMELPQDELVELAKETLSHAFNISGVPEGYLDELKTHVKFSKDDTLFRVLPQPGVGYGAVLCFEKGCDGLRIPLGKRSSATDDGKEDGIGSLSAYRYHTHVHPTHRKNCLARVALAAKNKGQPVAQPTSARSTPSGPPRALVPVRALFPPTISASLAPNRRGQSARSKADPDSSSVGSSSPASSSVMSRKRKSVGMDDEDTDITIPSSSPDRMSAAAAKRVKTEGVETGALHAPLRPVDSNSPRPQPSGSTSSSLSPRAAHAHLAGINQTIDGLTRLLGYFRGNKKKTPYNRQRIVDLKGELIKLSLEKEKYEAALRTNKLSGSVLEPPVTVKQDSFEALQTSNPFSNVRQPPATIKQEPFEALRTSNPSSNGRQPPATIKQDPFEATFQTSKPSDNALQPLVTVKRDPFVPRAGNPSGNVLQPPIAMRQEIQEAVLQTSQPSDNACQLPFTVTQAPFESDIKPLGEQPIASGSNAHIPAMPKPVVFGPNTRPDAPSSTVNELANVINGANLGFHPIPPANASLVPPSVDLPNYGDTTDNVGDYDSFRPKKHAAYRGPVANPGDIEKFLIEAGNSELFDGNESIDKALEKLGLKKLGERLPLMTIPLMPHQVIGVAWMREHEKGSHKGGILADEMGLGKTVQMIALMVLNRSRDPAVKSTLICAPVALLDQWKLEIETKTEGAFKCIIYHGANKAKHKTELQKYDVVLTTFQTLALEYDDPRVAERKKRKKIKSRGDSTDDFIETDSGVEKKAKKQGVLLKMSWFRVVLDEAQNIRNRNTRISIAVTNLDVKYRWCLTGTPVTNSLADCYGLIRFLEIRPWYDWNDFNEHIARIERKSPDLATRRMQAIFNSCLIRRKKDSLLDGKRLIELPPKNVVLQHLEFSQEERDIYNAVEAQSQAKFNRYLRAGTVLKNYTQVLVLLLRLRQLCSHPCLIQEDGYAYYNPAVKHEVQTELDRATILAGKDFVEQMKEKFKLVVLQRMAAEKESADAVIEEECPVCFDNLAKPLVTRCGHVFCEDCINAVLNQAAVEDGNEPRYAMSERPCPTCRAPIQKEMTFSRSAFEPTDADLENLGESSRMDVDDDDDGCPIGSDVFPTAKKGDASAPAPVPSKRGRGKKRFSKPLLNSDEEDDDDDEDDLSDFIVQSDEDEEEKDARRELKKKLGKNKRVVPDSEDVEMEDEMLPPTVIAKRKGKAKKVERFLPSTKMKEMMALLKTWAETEESKNEKTMVISQWTSCLDLVANYLEENGFTFVRYQGNMNRTARDEAVRTFMSQGKARIMLMSLKCGGVGLNLTRANRVISLDLGWSSAVESQAFDRVHRLGQARPVTVQRLVIANTVEARILALQERKQNLADGSLGEGSGKKLGRLSVKDLANLFGLDARGEAL